MGIFDIAMLAIFALAVIICVWKGFFKILAKFGALVCAVLLSKAFGARLGAAVVPDLVDGSGKLASVSEKINTAISSFIGTVVLLLIAYIVLRILFGILARVIGNAGAASKIDKILGAVIGILGGVAAIFVITEVFSIVTAVAAMIDPDTTLYQVIDESFIFDLIEKITL